VGLCTPVRYIELTNFMGTDWAFRHLDWEIKTSAIESIDWRFNPPTAASWVGWWECLIKLLKLLKNSGESFADMKN